MSDIENSVEFISILTGSMPHQKQHVICFDGEQNVPAIYYQSMARTSPESTGFYHFSTGYHSNIEGPYSDIRTGKEDMIQNVISWYPMPVAMLPFKPVVGMKVHYKPYHNEHAQNGIIKSLNEFDDNVAFVVYNCGGEWDNYQNYTGASTQIEDLKEGWL